MRLIYLLRRWAQDGRFEQSYARGARDEFSEEELLSGHRLARQYHTWVASRPAPPAKRCTCGAYDYDDDDDGYGLNAAQIAGIAGNA